VSGEDGKILIKKLLMNGKYSTNMAAIIQVDLLNFPRSPSFVALSLLCDGCEHLPNIGLGNFKKLDLKN
jgi:hypothetical protein